MADDRWTASQDFNCVLTTLLDQQIMAEARQA
jgi:hypothetical protein